MRTGGALPRLCDFSPPSAVILVQCHCEASANTGCGNPSHIPSAPLPKGGWHGEAVTGGFLSAPYLLLRSVGAGFYPARSSAPLVTDAGRCGHRPEPSFPALPGRAHGPHPTKMPCRAAPMCAAAHRTSVKRNVITRGHSTRGNPSPSLMPSKNQRRVRLCRARL